MTWSPNTDGNALPSSVGSTRGDGFWWFWLEQISLFLTSLLFIVWIRQFEKNSIIYLIFE